jgi:hypothetical protein
VRKIKDATCVFLNLFSDKLNQFASSEEVRRWKESEKVKQARCNLWNKIDKNDPNSPYIIEAILQKTFNREELQYKDNIIFGVTVVLMFLDPKYDQAEISASKVQERMKKWNPDPLMQSLVSYCKIDMLRLF